jgi:uncharacterized membrane protein HdeD (DUF308 family)
MTNEEEQKPGEFARKLWWLTLLRGIIALSLGISLLLTPDGTLSNMLRFVGLYWLTSGLAGVAWGISGAQRPGAWLILGGAEVVGGVGLALHPQLMSYFSLNGLKNLAAVFAILIGGMHLVIGYGVRQKFGRQWSWGSFIMGLLQVFIGILLLAPASNNSAALFYAASAWAFIGGFSLMANGIRLRRLALTDNVEDGKEHEKV